MASTKAKYDSAHKSAAATSELEIIKQTSDLEYKQRQNDSETISSLKKHVQDLTVTSQRVDRLTKELSDRQTELNKFRESATQIQSEHGKALDDIAKLKRLVEEQASTISANSQQDQMVALDALRMELTEKHEAQIVDIQEQAQKNIESFTSESQDQKQKLIQDHQRQTEEATAKMNAQMEQLNQQAEYQMSQARMEWVAKLMAQMHVKSELEQKIADSDSYIAELKKTSEELHAMIDGLDHELVLVQEKLANDEAIRRECDEWREKYQALLAEKGTQEKEVESTVYDLRKSLTDKDTEMADFIQLKQLELESKIAEFDAQAVMINLRNEESRRKKEEAEKTCNDLNSRLEDILKQLEVSRTENQELQKKLDSILTTTPQIEALEKNVKELESIILVQKQAEAETSQTLSLVYAEKNVLAIKLEAAYAERDSHDAVSTTPSKPLAGAEIRLATKKIFCYVCEEDGDHLTDECPRGRMKWCDNCDTAEHDTEDCPNSEETF